MVKRIRNLKTPAISDVDLAIAAIEESPQPNPLDMDVTRIDPDPTSLDLDITEEAEICSNARCSRLATHECAACGSLVCDDCDSS
jgi:hypothetical protein